MIVRAVCTGDELLDGRVRDLNIWAMGKMLAERGLRLDRVILVDDALEAIEGAIASSSQGCDLVLVTGGLGPTSDDRTRDAIASLLGVALVEDREDLERILTRMKKKNYPFTENNRKQASFPEGAELFASEVGSASSFAVELNGALVVSMPGVPREMGWFMEHHLDAWLVRAGGEAPRARIRRSLHFFGIGESQLEDLLAGIDELAAAQEVQVAWRADFPTLTLSLFSEQQGGIEALEAFTRERAAAHLVGADEEQLFEHLARLLVEQRATVSAAESCTAGLLAGAFTAVPGSSAYIEQSFVTYSNAAKSSLVGVDADVVERFGAVSAQTVCQMASGVKKTAGATYGLGISGIAGPGGGTPEKPVGTVHFALAGPTGTYHRQVLLSGRSRDQVRQASVYIAASLLLWTLQGEDMSDRPVSGPYSEDEVWAEGGIQDTPITKAQ